MSCLEKHVSHKASMKHPSNLDSFMDETDREVMSLTDRAFKSLCIGDEAIYNDSELLSSPVDCHKPLAEEIPKKPRENTALDVKKHGAHRPNGVYNTPWQMKKNTKVSSLFATFAAKNNDTKMTNGDLWDKSGLLSIQTELSDFSSDYQNHLRDEQLYQVKSHCKPSKKETLNKASQNRDNSSGKSFKNQHSKSTKLRKLNPQNFFLHSEFSPFQSWGDLNRFGLENMDMFPCNSLAGLYDSPLSRELNNSNRLLVPESNKRETSQSTSPMEPQHKSKPDLSQCSAQTLKTAPPVPEKPSELNFQKLPDIQIETLQPQMQLTSSGSFQRCQSEGDLYAPWRKSRSRAKGADRPLISSPACEKSNTGEEGAIQTKKEVKTVEEAPGLNSTPFSISQLLTPVIPSRQGTGTSEILQSVHSPAALDIPALHETDIRPSPDIKRERYKSKASSLLFNLKDNRKRVKATYSPPKFKGLDVADQNKLSPLIEQNVTKNVLESPEITDSKTTSTVQKTSMYPMSPETADIQTSRLSGHINSALPDDFLGLSLLQAGNRGSPIKSLKSKKNPLAKATYPSLNLYRKSSPVELNTKSNTNTNTKTMPMDAPGSHSTINKSTEEKLSKRHLPEKNRKELQRKSHLTKPEINNANHEYIHLNHVETADKVLTDKTDAVALKEKYVPIVSLKHSAQQDVPTLSGSRNQDKLNMEEIFKVEERPIKYTEYHRKEPKPNHLFSARQNNYIKNLRYVDVVHENDDNDDECAYWQENVISVGRDEPRKKILNVDVHKDKGKVQENVDEPFIKESVTNDAFTKNNYNIPLVNDLGICTEQGVAKNDAFSMKGNTSAKVALFTLKEQPSNRVLGSKKNNIVKDKYELATVALEKRIAEREQRKKQSDRQSGQDLPMKGDHNKESMLTLGQKETSGSVIPDRRGQNHDTNHDECHVPEVKLAEPYKQEGTAKHSPSRLVHRDRSDRHGQQGDTSNIQSMANITEFKETVCVPKNLNLSQEVSVVQDYFDNKLIGVDENEPSIQKKKGSYKPEAPPRRERVNSQREDSTMSERQIKEAVGSIERSVNYEDCLSTEVKKSNLSKNKGPVKGHVSSLAEKFNREQVLPSSNIQECLSQGDGLMVNPGYDLLKQKTISPKNTMGFSEVEEILTKHNHKAREIDSDNKELPDNDSKLAMGNETNLGGEIGDKQDIQTVNKYVTENEEDKKDVTKTENESASGVLRKTDNQSKSKCHGESSVKKYLTDHLGKSDEPDDESEKTPTLNLINPGNAPVNKIILYDILNQADPSSLVDIKQVEQDNLLSRLSEDSSFSHKTEESSSLSKAEERKCENLDQMDSCSNSNPESKLHNLDIAVPPPKDVEKRGWVQCLIDSAHNLTPTCQSNASSPTLGKLALFKVKDNTFSASPVTKTVKPILHKTVAGVTQPWSPKESLSGSERGEEDPDLFKDFVDVQSPTLLSTPIQINQSSTQVAPPPSPQATTDQEKTRLMDSSTVPKDDEWQLATYSVSEGIESCEMSAGDTVGELAFNTACTDSIVGSKAPSERSESACSGIENQVQGKPPAVPPKTEKALRRAMKLTTKRIQKVEAKNKSERGRSSEKGSKGSCQKRERRHHSCDKVLTDRSYQREHSIDRGSSNQSTGANSSETSLLKSHTSETHATQHNKPNSRRKEKDIGRKLQHERHSSLINTDDDAKSSVAEKQKENRSQHKDQCDTHNINVDHERLGRTSEKYLPHKLYRRAHSLDRFSSGKQRHQLLSSEEPVSKTTTETLNKPDIAQIAPLRQNSIEQTYGSPANNIVPQSFPITQRKLLQDLDSGQYFVVDMPVQVKTKTFFDPETGSYVQLPIQSLDGSVPRAQSVEVVNAPPLMLYHGFVPVPVSSLP